MLCAIAELRFRKLLSKSTAVTTVWTIAGITTMQLVNVLQATEAREFVQVNGQ
ncbi:MAG: hypothetical protein K6T90_15170 [Leptolyngbyaceae cyanobacterium HOT.MB2.61]|jgi:hypothetical protein|nr:hypothetical protein [Leptolyngbyaceae cyanobacterium HOT.MB2.61]